MNVMTLGTGTTPAQWEVARGRILALVAQLMDGARDSGGQAEFGISEGMQPVRGADGVARDYVYTGRTVVVLKVRRNAQSAAGAELPANLPTADLPTVAGDDGWGGDYGDA